MNVTPRPWFVDENRIDRVDNMIACLKEDEGTVREWIAIGIADKEGYAESTAYCHPDNASLIVRAVNTFDEVREALVLAHRMLLQTDWSQEDGALNEIEAVLAKLKGGAE